MIILETYDTSDKKLELKLLLEAKWDFITDEKAEKLMKVLEKRDD
jgi:hypothetical protein